MEIPWRKSSFSADTGNCLELASHNGDILVRESDQPDVILKAAPEELRAFLTGVKVGQFDHLV